MDDVTARLAVVDRMAMCVYRLRDCDTGAESDVCECLVLIECKVHLIFHLIS